MQEAFAVQQLDAIYSQCGSYVWATRDCLADKYVCCVSLQKETLHEPELAFMCGADTE